MDVNSGTATGSSLLQMLGQIESAKSPKELYGSGDVEKLYRRFMLSCHPDKFASESEALRKRGENAFKKVREYYDLLNGKKAAAPAVFGKWVVEHAIVGGDLADIYQVTSASTPKGILKIVRSANDNDLQENEIAALRDFHKEATNPFQRYFPNVLESFKASGRRAIIMTPAEMALKDGPIEPMVSLEEILRRSGGKIDFRHMVWMSNRLLSALGYVHNRGRVHGAIVPSHLMYGPESHGLTLVDWCYSVTGESKKHIPAIVKDYRHLYPKEIFRKEPPMPGTDLFMWAMIVKASTTVPRRFDGLLDWCLADSRRARPQDAWKIQDQWGTLAAEEFGKPKYLKLQLSR